MTEEWSKSGRRVAEEWPKSGQRVKEETMVGVLTTRQMLKQGLDLIGISHYRQKRIGRDRLINKFKSHYGRHPFHLAKLWRDLLTTTNQDALVDENDDRNILGFFAACNFLKVYAMEEVRDDFMGENMHLNEIRSEAWKYTRKIAALKGGKIVWPADHEWQTTFIISVDGTHRLVNEPRDPNVRRNPKWYSHKDEHAGMNFEVGVDLFRSRIVHVKVGTPASTHDLTEFRMELAQKIPAGKRVIADKVYACEEFQHMISTYNQFDSAELKEFKKRAKARHETVNDRIKKYGCMKQHFRHGIQKAQICCDAVVVMVQYAIEDTGPYGEPLFDI